jgi:hypothetical protein
VAELRRHYLSKNLCVNFPSTTEYRDLQETLAAGNVDSRVGYRVEIGSREILNLGKLPSANVFLERRYGAYFDDFLGIEYTGRVAAVLARVGADGLRRLLQERRNGGTVGRGEPLEAMTTAGARLRTPSGCTGTG